MTNSSNNSSFVDEKEQSQLKVATTAVTGADNHLQYQLSTFKSANGHNINVIRSQDRQLALEQLGYKQELKRSYSYFDLFGVAFSIMGLLPSICAIFTQSTSAGASSSWGWLFTSFCGILPVGIALAELGSAFPSASAVYLSAWKFAPEKYKDVCAYSVCVLDSIALSAGACSVFFSASGQILSCVQVAKPDFVVTHGKKYGVYAAIIILGSVFGSFSGGVSTRIQQISVYFNTFLLILVFIALPIGTKHKNIPFNDGKFLFGNAENYSNWSIGGNWILNALVPAAWTISAFDSPIHMSEEAIYAPRNMKKHVLLDPKASPAAFGIILSISACGLLGWLMMICLYACMGPSVDAIMDSSYTSIVTQIFMNSLGQKWTIAIMSLIAIGCFLMGISAIMATSRNFYALCRDRVLPPFMADWLAVVDKKTNTPIRAMYGTCTVSLLLGLLIFQDQGANSLFTIAVAGFYMALAIPMFLKITYARKTFDKGPFYLGDKLSFFVNLVAVGYQAFMIVLMMIPSVNHPDKGEMNYTVVFTFGILALALSGYYMFMHKYFKGPRSNLTDEEYLEAVGEENAGIDAIFSVEDKK
ncbi:amino acid transporter [Hanseniaspora valbyensis NRRL Y-1626]|uniref:Amino acid transporter n=1 Tax=Hanseniaspora valbyensis NRRL Y-1626 TaxID=766949 RepID=A0A1B7TJB0_9ASCO|nr:amino acid transporter [Hanseniaspora valbyensis NRRL Y-1626]